MSLPGKITFLMMLCSGLNAAAQNNKLFRMDWVAASAGMNGMSGYASDTSAFLLLARRDDPAFHADLGSYHKEHGFSFDGGAEFSAALGLRIRSREGGGFNSRRLLRLGINYAFNTFLSAGYNAERSVRYDTLNSTGSGTTLYLDSIYHYRYDFTFRMQQAALEGAFIFNTDTGKLFGLYGGVSLAQYISTLNTVSLSRDTFVQLKETNLSGQSHNYTGGGKAYHAFRGDYRSVRARASFSTRIGLPVGGTLRLGRRKKVFRNIQLFGEAKPCLLVTVVAGYRAYVRPAGSWQLGVRLLFSKS